MAKSSVSGVKVNNSSQQSIKDQMAANSAAWHSADASTKKQLEQANKDLAAQLGGLSFNSGSGTWSGTASKPSGTSSGSGSSGVGKITAGTTQSGSGSSASNKVTLPSVSASPSKVTGSSGPSSGGSSGASGSSGSGGYTKKYTGGNAALDAALAKYSTAYQEARAKALAGDQSAITAMVNANDAANQLRNQYGYAAELADDDINFVKKSIGYNTASSGGMTPTVTTPGATTPTYSDLLKEQQNAYDQIQAEQEKAKRAAVEQAIDSLSQQKDQVGQSYSDLFKQLYIDRKMAEKRMPQQLAAMGYSGGLTESSLLGLRTNYAEALRQGEQERINTLSDIDRAISDTQLQGDISIADLAAQNAKDKLASYTSIIQALQDQANVDKQFAMQQEELAYTKLLNQLAQENADREFEYQQAQDEQAQANWLATMNRQQLLDQLEREDLEYERKLAAAQYLYEATGDASGLRTLGYTDGQIQALQQRAAAMLSSGDTAPAAYKPILTYSQVLEQINAGNLAPQVLADYEHYFGGVYQSPGYRNVNSYVARIADTLNGPNKVYNYIQNAVANGIITEAEAETLLRNYGLM